VDMCKQLVSKKVGLEISGQGCPNNERFQ
jgi:hypothetical protein